MGVDAARPCHGQAAGGGDRQGQGPPLRAIRPALLGREAAPSYAQISESLGLSESLVKVAVHRYRTRFRALLREEIALTLSDPDEIEEEITTLIQALAD